MRTREESEKLELAAKFIYESNLIENITTPFDKIWREWTKNPLTGHVAALSLATSEAKMSNKLTEKMLCEWQKLIIQEQNSTTTNVEKIIPECETGYYRRSGKMFVADKLCVVPAQAVSNCMEQLLEETNYLQRNLAKPEEEIIKKIADFHFDFLWIHPFVDGNGRTARIMTWYLFSYFDIKPFIFSSNDKHETYYKAFDGMRDYFLSKSRA